MPKLGLALSAAGAGPIKIPGSPQSLASSIPPGYLAFWKLSNLTDSSPNGYTLTNSGNVQFVAGKIGNCAQFNGSNALYSTLTTPSLNSVSLSLWARSNSSGIPFNVGNREDAGLTGTFRLITVGGTTLVWQINPGGGDRNCVSTFSNNNTWQHIVGTYNGSIMRLYVNAVEVQTFAGSGVLNAGRPFIIGGQWMGYPTFSANSVGSVDAVGVWDKALTQQEVDTLYNSGNGREP